MKYKLRLLILAALFNATSSLAMPMDYTFEIDFTTGTLAGTIATVFVTLDGVTSGATEWCEVGSSGCRLEVFDFTFGTDSFSIWNDITSSPVVFLTGGVLSGASFRVQEDERPFAQINFTQVSYKDSSDVESTGTVDLTSWALVENVPAPATLALFGLGLAGLGWSRRKQYS